MKLLIFTFLLLPITSIASTGFIVSSDTNTMVTYDNIPSIEVFSGYYKNLSVEDAKDKAIAECEQKLEDAKSKILKFSGKIFEIKKCEIKKPKIGKLSHSIEVSATGRVFFLQ